MICTFSHRTENSDLTYYNFLRLLALKFVLFKYLILFYFILFYFIYLFLAALCLLLRVGFL